MTPLEVSIKRAQMQVACLRVCMACSGGFLHILPGALGCARENEGNPPSPDWHCAVQDIDAAIREGKFDEAGLEETVVSGWMAIRGLPLHDAVAEILARYQPAEAAEPDQPGAQIVEEVTSEPEPEPSEPEPPIKAEPEAPATEEETS